MIKMSAKCARGAAALALCALIVCTFSCRYLQRDTTARVAFEGEPTGTGLSIAARFATAEDDAPEFFLKAMPDSGIVPVRVSIRNEGRAPLLVHSANGMKLPASFEGFALVAGRDTYLPLTPKAVAERVLGTSKAARFRMRSATSFVAGTFIAPIGAFYLYSEVDIGRYYRPIFKKSLYPAFESGMMKPVRIEPGEERSGYLYFAIPESVKPDSCELLVRACLPGEESQTIAGSDFLFSRGLPHGRLFVMGEAKNPGLHICDNLFRHFEKGVHYALSTVTQIAAKGASIADASGDGSLTACAVNFRAKSRVYLVRIDGKRAPAEEKSFGRKVRRVHVAEAGVFVVTEDRRCSYYDRARGAWSRGVKLGLDIDDTAVVNGRLIAFSKANGMTFFEATDGASIARSGEKALRPARRTAIGLLEGDLVLLTKGRSVRRDTLSLLDAETMGEIGRGSLPGKVQAASSDGSNLVLQFEDGTIARIVRGSGTMFSIEEAGYLPFTARTIGAVPGGFIAVGEEAEIAAGSVDSFRPGARGALELSVTVR